MNVSVTVVVSSVFWSMAYADCAEALRVYERFRDRLRDVPEERAAYERTKRELATRTWDRVQDYADAKTEVVEAIIDRARKAD